MTHEPKITILEPLLSFLRYEILMAESSASSFFTFRTMPRNLLGNSSKLKQFDANADKLPPYLVFMKRYEQMKLIMKKLVELTEWQSTGS